MVLSSFEEAEKARTRVENSKKYVTKKYGNIDFYRFTDEGKNRIKSALDDINKLYGKFADLQLKDECTKYIDECERIININIKKLAL